MNTLEQHIAFIKEAQRKCRRHMEETEIRTPYFVEFCGTSRKYGRTLLAADTAGRSFSEGLPDT